MTSTEKNNLLFRRVSFMLTTPTPPNPKLAKALRYFKQELLKFTTPFFIGANTPPLITTTAQLISRVRAFIKRAREDDYPLHTRELASKLLQCLQSPPNEPEVTWFHPSGSPVPIPISTSQLPFRARLDISIESKATLLSLMMYLEKAIATQDTASILSADRLRLLKADLVYLRKRQHLLT